MEVKPDGTLNYVVGTTYGSIEVLRLPTTPLPPPTPGNFPICAIEFFEGQTEIRRDSTERNIIDLRMFTSAAESGAGYQWHTSTEMTSPIDADEYGVYDVTNNVLKKITELNLRKSMFKDTEGVPSDVIYSGSASAGTSTYSARRDHVHLSQIVQTRIVMVPDLIDPPVPVLTPDGDDYVYYTV
jgi:hypothetical protein